ncbi:hypothetical protein BH10PAT2_BH10PAT2_1640 [soil metagenome]
MHNTENFQETVRALSCPYCDQKFSGIYQLQKKEGKVFGYVRCSCDEFPIVRNILYLKKDIFLRNRHSVFEIKKGNLVEATALLIEGYTKLETTFMQLLVRKKLLSKRAIPVIFQILGLINPEYASWYRYILSRTSRVTFVLSLLNTQLCRSSSTVLDVGCGFSHFLNYVHKQFKTKALFGVDERFFLLYFSTHYFSELPVFYICQDVNIGLPFREELFDFIFCNDAFMYLFQKMRVIKSLSNTLKKKGYLFLSHVHGDSKDNFAEGYGVTLAQMELYRQKLSLVGLADKKILEHMLHHEKTVLVPPSKMDQRAVAYTFCMRKVRQLKLQLFFPTALHNVIDEGKLNYDTEVFHISKTKLAS